MRSRLFVLGTAVLLSGPWLSADALAADQPGIPVTSPLPVKLGGASRVEPTFTLEQAIAQAFSSNPALRVAEQGVSITEGARIQAGLIPNPELSVLREGAQRTNRTQTVQISQPLELGGKRSARIGVADLDRTLAVGDLRIKSTELRADVTAAYFDALTAQERVELAQGSLDLANKASMAASRRVTAGKISPVEETRSKVAATSARLELVQANGDLNAAKRRLTALWGSSEPLLQRLSHPEPDSKALPRLEALQAQLEAAPQLQRARSQIMRDEAQVKLERSQRIPDVAVTLGNKKDYEMGRSQTVVGLSIPLPLFNRNQGNLLSAQRKVEQAKIQLEVEKLEVSQALADAWQRAQVSQEQIDAMRVEMLPAAQSALDAAVTGFELGKFNFLDVLDAQRTLFQARAQYLNAMSERYRAITDIQRYVPLDEAAQHVTTDRNTK